MISLLFSGWVQKYDREGQMYWENEKSGRTTWTAPQCTLNLGLREYGSGEFNQVDHLGGHSTQWCTTD
jgi:hypothetical protein